MRFNPLAGRVNSKARGLTDVGGWYVLRIALLLGAALMLYWAKTQGVGNGPIAISIAILAFVLTQVRCYPSTNCVLIPRVTFALGGLCLVPLWLWTGSLFVGAATWALGALALLEESDSVERECRISRWFPVFLFAFPWIQLDGLWLSYALCQSAGILVQVGLTAFGYEVVRQGMVLVVDGHLVEITHACSGDDMLSASLGLGAVLLAAQQKSLAKIVAVLFGLLALCWIGNIARIAIISGVAGQGVTQAFERQLHDGLGWVFMGLALSLTAFWCWRNSSKPAAPVKNQEIRGVSAPKKIRFAPRRPGALTTIQLAQLTIVLLIVATFGLRYWRATTPVAEAMPQWQTLAERLEEQGASLLELPEEETLRMGDALVRRLQFNMSGRRFNVTMIDGSRDRRRVHDPRYCWTIRHFDTVPVSDGTVAAARLRKDNSEKDLLFWYSDGKQSYTSSLRYYISTSLRRAGFSSLVSEPILVIVEPMDAGKVNWYQLIDRHPELFSG